MQTKHSLITDSNPKYQQIFEEFDKQSPNRNTWYFYSVFCQCVNIDNFRANYFWLFIIKGIQNNWYKIAKQYGLMFCLIKEIQKKTICV